MKPPAWTAVHLLGVGVGLGGVGLGLLSKIPFVVVSFSFGIVICGTDGICVSVITCDIISASRLVSVVKAQGPDSAAAMLRRLLLSSLLDSALH